jgi:uncharacterized membrane-anchored protein
MNENAPSGRVVRGMTIPRLASMLVIGCLCALPSAGQEIEEPALDVEWIEGPSAGDLGKLARVVVPDNYVFAGAKDTKRLMEVMQNPVSGSELGFLAPVEEDWFIVFEYEPIGYVKDDEKDELDADALLESIREGTREANKIRQENGWETLEVVGWHERPHYNQETHNLEWATLARSSGGDTIINHNTRLLGRQGVMSATLVADPDQIETILPVSKSLLDGYEYLPGKKYSEFRSGDKIAEYGLTALITGGAAAVALKTGLLQKFWKVIVVGFIALVGFLKKVLATLFGREVKAEDAGPYGS